MKCNWKDCEIEILENRKFCSQSCNAKYRNSNRISNLIQINCDRSKRSLEIYLLNPKYCNHCNIPLDYEKRRNKFCNHSCAAIFNNPNKSSVKRTKSNRIPWTDERRRLWGIKMKNRNVKFHVWTDEDRKLASERSKRINDRYWTEDKRKEQSERMKKIVQKYPESYSAKNVCGRNKQVEYNGIKLNSTWELSVVNWFEENGICWERNTTGFQYYWEEKQSTHTYFPDFYLSEYDKFVEVKGYETERDRCKWKVVDNLIVIGKQEIKDIESNTFKF